MNTDLAKKYFRQALDDNGLEGQAIPFDPPIAGAVIRRYQDLMRAAGYCPSCEQPLDECKYEAENE